MSRAPEHLSREPRREQARGFADDGFTLIEVMVALVLLSIVAAATGSVLIVSARASVSTRLETEAKNLAQERVEFLRQLQYHVDRQNGPYIDLLDRYYPNRVTAAGTGSGWVSAGTTRQPGEPATGAFYRTRLSEAQVAPGFTQVVTAQFLLANRAPLADASFPTYDSQVAGRDESPTPLLGITVITSWNDGTAAKSFRVFTQITPSGRADALLASQARGIALQVESTNVAGEALTAEAAVTTAEGHVSTGSTASVQASAARGTRTAAAAVTGAEASALSPGGAQPDEVNATAVTSGSPCGYAAYGRSRVDEVTSAVTNGVPLAPAAVGQTTTPSTRATSMLLGSPGGGCGAFHFDNDTAQAEARLRLVAGAPVVAVTGVTTGSTPIVRSTAWVNGTTDTANPRFVRAGSSAATTEPIELFYTDYSGGQPLVRIWLVSSAIECDSRTAGAVASYRVVIDYRASSGSRSTIIDRTWSSSTSGSTDPLAAMNLAAYVVDAGSGLTLADYIGSWSFATSISEGATNGVAGLDAALRVTTTPLRGSVEPLSSVGIVVGRLSCAADDSR